MGKPISDIKPEKIPGKQRPIPKIVWNDRTTQSYKDNGFFDPDQLPRANMQEREFLQVVDERQGPIERTVTKIVRLKAVDHTTAKKERKEYLYYFENWTGKNWLGLPIAPVTDHVEGMYYEQLKELKLDPRTGDALEYVRKGQREAYYIPFSKKTIDDIITKSNGSNLQTIKYIVKFEPEDSPDGQMRAGSRGQFSYEQFTSWTFEDLYKLHIKPWRESDLNIGPTQRMYK